jgi:hypothetical protein
MLKGILTLIPLVVFCASSAFGSVMNYTSEAAWLAATTGSTSYFSEEFQGNHINTPGLGVSNCSWDCMSPAGLDFIADSTYYAADGKHAYQINGQSGSYVTTTFTMPADIDGVGFWMNVPQSTPQSPLGMVVTTTDGSSSYWQWGDLNESQSPAFDGFLGFVTPGSDISSIQIVGGSPQISEIVGADPTFPVSAPEPVTFGMIGASLIAFGCRRLSRR